MGGKKSKPISTELTEDEITVLKTNTKYTEDEIRQWHTTFLRDCPDGRLDHRKFVEVYQEFFPQGNATQYCQYAFNTFDMNNDGTIDFNEFLLSMAATNHGQLEDRLGVAFDVYDISKDGLIDKKELIKILTAIYDLVGENERRGDRHPEARADEIIRRFDFSGEKLLSKDEFIEGCKNDTVICQLLAPHI